MTTNRLPKILIVEDDPDSRDALVLILRGAGYETLGSDCAEKALESILRHNIDMLIGDLQLPGMDGIELLKHVKAAKPETEVILRCFHRCQRQKRGPLRIGEWRNVVPR
jgi:DNA-binding NtrC family response regulator